MDISHGVRQHFFHEFFVNFFWWLRLLWDRAAEVRFNMFGYVFPDRSFSNGFQIIHHVVQHLVTQLSHGFPVVRIKRLLTFNTILSLHIAYLYSPIA
jgi:hypothetical protein